PQRRYDSAKALAEDLQRWLDGEPIEARPAGLLRRLGASARRHRAALAVGAAAVMVIAAISALAGRAALRARQLARLGQDFSREAEAIETSLRVAHLLPSHDLRREREQVRSRMQRLEATMLQLGELAQ